VPVSPLENATEALGYGSAPGFVDSSVAERGARDYVWRDLRDKCEVDAAYFSGAVPLVAFVQADTSQDVGEAHRRLWNFCRVPVLIAATDQSVFALSCFERPSADGSVGPLLASARRGQPLSKVLGEFSRFSVEAGRLATLHPGRFDRRNRVDRSLLDNLRFLRRRLLSTAVSPSIAETLIGRSIFIRYLEDRMILSPEHLQQLGGRPSYVETLREGSQSVVALFEALAEHFNGDIFRSSTDFAVSNEALDALADFLSGARPSGQQALWPYDFRVIPSELISSIYEQLLEESQKKTAAYYTPRHVVDLILDEVLPWDGISTNVSILDPSCGSGIFLSEAFRRLVYRHIDMQGNQGTFDVLSSLLTSSIHGVDLSAPAIGVTAFGLYLALLERVDPPSAWRDARLPTLVGRNLIVADYFDEHRLSHRRFDTVVGNPPWKSALTAGARRYVRERSVEVADQQIALAFLWRAHDQLIDHGVLGMVVPAKALLHNRSPAAARARRALFSKLEVETVIDLSPVRRETFGSASNPGAVVILNASAAQRNEAIVYLSPRRTPLAREIDGIAVSQRDVYRIPRALAATDPGIWKAYLWGSEADAELITRLRERFRALGDVGDDNGWVIGQGFQVEGGGAHDATHLLGMKYLSPEGVHALKVDLPTAVVTDAAMHRTRDPRLFVAPHIVLRNGFSDWPTAAFAEFDAAFADGLFGIAGPPRHGLELKAVAAILNSALARYWLFLTSSSWGVEREKVELSEYKTLPLPSLVGDTAIAFARITERATAASEPIQAWQADLDALSYKAYGLNRDERELVLERLSLGVGEFRLGPDSPSFAPVGKGALQTYSRALQRRLRSASSLPWTVTTRARDLFVVGTCRSGIETDGEITDAVGDLVEAVVPVDAWRSPAAVIQPAAIVVQGGLVHVVKVNQRRNWTRSVARSDAADVLGAVLLSPVDHGD